MTASVQAHLIPAVDEVKLASLKEKFMVICGPECGQEIMNAVPGDLDINHFVLATVEGSKLPFADLSTILLQLVQEKLEIE